MKEADSTNGNALFSFWKDLTPSQAALLEKSMHTETFLPGTILHRSAKDCRGILAVHSGALRVYCVSEEGREVTLYRVEKGEVCILSASCLMDSIVFDVVIQAAEETQVCLIPSSALHTVEQENPLVSLYIYKNATEKFSDVLWTLQQILFMKIDQRIAAFLHDRMLRQKTNVLTLTHEEIAGEIGSVREVVSKTLKYMAEEGMVSLGRGKITILSSEKLNHCLP